MRIPSASAPDARISRNAKSFPGCSSRGRGPEWPAMIEVVDWLARWRRERGWGLRKYRRWPDLVALQIMVVACAWLACYGTLRQRPIAAVHDEQAYLLAADTYLSGRLANPVHPCWEHFQSFHVLQHPKRQAKYPPGQGLSLALGTLLGGGPEWGVWLTFSLGLGACAWLLMAVVPPLLAAALTLAFLVHQPVLDHWGETYWGGGLAFLGGALLFGALLRLGRGADTRQGWIAAAGLWVLGNTRPLEGALAAGIGLACVALRGADARRSLVRPRDAAG